MCALIPIITCNVKPETGTMHYYSYNKYLRERFGEKVRKISLNAGFACPNRDGTISTEGCVFCNEFGFSVGPQKTVSLKGQIEASLAVCKKKFGNNKFIAYFQNGAGTNAGAKDLKTAYDVIKDYPEIVGLSISTRPDCIDEEKLDMIAGFLTDYDVWIEYGVQTVHNKTLKNINRGHTFLESFNAINLAASRGIKVCAHVILGLPGETQKDMMLTADEVSSLEVSGIKLHVLHVLTNTKLAEMYNKGCVDLLRREEYVKIVCSFLEKMKAPCVIMRLVSDAWENYLLAPDWIKNKQLVMYEIEKEFARRGTRQGCLRN